MTIRILRARDRAVMPWKNGGGVTREVASFPPGADLDTFDWRVSMASVSVGGPFSFFPGVDRALAVLEGELRLVFQDGAILDLNPRSAPAAFAGDAPVRAETPNGPVTDLNVMTRRGKVRARVTRLASVPSRRQISAATTLFLALSGEARIHLVNSTIYLGRHDALLIDGPLGEGFNLDSAAPVLQIDFSRTERLR